MTELSLLRLCVLKTASLLIETSYGEIYDHDFGDNPFSALPSNVIEELIQAVIQLTPSGTLNVSYLYPLLTSNRVRHFKLEDVVLSTDQLVSILMSLSICGQNLISIIIRNIFCSDYFVHQNSTKNFLKDSAMNCLLSVSPSLESLESSIEFNLSTIRKTISLKNLKLNFVPKCPLHNILLEIDGDFIPNNSLTYLYIFEDYRNPVSTVEIACLLKYCEELVSIENDIAKSLEHLHEDELADGILAKEYKLQKCLLGSAFAPSYQASASVTAIQIATITCPSLKELDVLVSDHNAIYALSDFKNLCSLLIQWDPMNFGDFRIGLELLLTKIGNNLKFLDIRNFGNIDFYAVAELCPMLEVLKIEFDWEARGYEAPETCLLNMKTLDLESTDGNGASEDTLVSLLSNCQDLTSLRIVSLSALTDDVIRKIFEKNNLSKLKELTTLNCNINSEGLRNIVINCENVEYIHFSSLRLSFDTAVEIVHDINPHIIMRSDVL